MKMMKVNGCVIVSKQWDKVDLLVICVKGPIRNIVMKMAALFALTVDHVSTTLSFKHYKLNMKGE